MSIAPDFTLDDFQDNSITLSDYRDEKNVILVFNRGFAWPFCRRHMAQLRRDYEKFVAQDTEILVVGPEDANSFAYHWRRQEYPFIGLPDPKHRVADQYGQEVKLLRMGRMPALIVIDKAGRVRHTHYGESMRDIPKNETVLQILDRLNQE